MKKSISYFISIHHRACLVLGFYYFFVIVMIVSDLIRANTEPRCLDCGMEIIGLTFLSFIFSFVLIAIFLIRLVERECLRKDYIILMFLSVVPLIFLGIWWLPMFS